MVAAYRNTTSRKQRITILNVLAAYYTSQALKHTDQAREDFFNLATSTYNKADKIDVHVNIDGKTWVGKGMLLLSKNSFDRAIKYFDTALEHNPSNTPALLGKVCYILPVFPLILNTLYKHRQE